MATRAITGTILRPDGTPWAGAAVRFTTTDDAYTVSPAETFPLYVVTAVTDEYGEFTVDLVADLSVNYKVTLPDRSSFEITVPSGSPTTLEVLRAATSGMPVAVDSLEAALIGLYGSPPAGRAALALKEGGSPVIAEATALNFDASDFNVTESPTGQGNISLAYGTAAGTPAEGNHVHAGWTPASSAGPASVAFAEDTDNGSNKITLAGPASLSSDFAQTLPPATGTLALKPTITIRTNSASVANGASTSVVASCSGNEVCVGGGYSYNSAASTVPYWSFPSGSTQWTAAMRNNSGSSLTLITYAVCADFGS